MHISRVEEISKFYSSNTYRRRRKKKKPIFNIKFSIHYYFSNESLLIRGLIERYPLETSQIVQASILRVNTSSLSLFLEDSFKLINSSSLDYSFLPIPLPLERTTGPSRTSWSKCRTQIPFPSPDPCPIQGMTRTIG